MIEVEIYEYQFIRHLHRPDGLLQHCGHLIGSTNGSSTNHSLTDAEGSLLMNLSNTAVNGEQLYTPYGTTRYQKGTLGTAKAFTGQEADPLTGLYYYNARYYDPVSGQFLSADDVQGNTQGMDPYSYVGGNPETRTDPTGERYLGGGGDPSPPPPTPAEQGDNWEHDPTFQPSLGGDDTVIHIRVFSLAPQPTPAGQSPKPRGNGKSGNRPTCEAKCGKSTGPNYGLLAEGIGEFVGATVLIGIGIYGLVTATESGLIGLVADVLKNGFGGVAYLANDGIKKILDAFGNPSPWLKVFFDVVAIILDLVQIAVNVIDLIAGGGGSLASAETLKTLGEDINQVVGKILIENPGRLLETVQASMRAAGLGLIVGAPSFVGDSNTLGNDWNTAAGS